MSPLVVLAIVLTLVLALAWQFPGAADGMDERMRILYLLLFLLIIGTGARVGRLSLNKSVQYAGIWLIVILGLMLAYYGLKGLAD